jgi:choline dehydrogenase
MRMDMQRTGQGGQEFDFIVVGAGSAGCALANRLSVDGTARVLLIEAGGADRSINFKVPLMVVNLLKDPNVTWPFITEPQSALKNRVQLWTRGRVLGGSSSINGNVYVRGDPAVFDSWADLGCPGWGWQDMLPSFKRMEDYPQGSPAVRGRGGPIGVTKLERFDKLADGFLAASREAGHKLVDDYNDGNYEGTAYLQYSTRRGYRSSSSVGYLRPARGRANLEVWTDTQVARILIEGRRAVGVECERGGQMQVARARKEVVLSAGPIQSPKLLELSGIGRGDILAKHGIPVVRELPGVGENLQDHPNTRLTFHCTEPITINDVLQNPLVKVREGLKYILFGKGLLSICSATAHTVMRSRLDATSPDLKIQLQPFSGKDRYARRPQDGLDPHSGFTVGVMALKPKSRGWVHIASADPFANAKIDPKYLDDPDDAQVLLAGIKAVRDVASRPSLKRLIVRETRPGEAVATDAEILDYIRETTQTTWHVVGSCRMGTDRKAVVDTELRVHGIDGLRVADSSVFPTIPSSNTNAPTIALGERAADIIRDAWRNRRTDADAPASGAELANS